MIECSGIREVCEYAISSQYCCAPTGNVAKKDSVVAGHWNYMWHEANEALIGARLGLGNVICEINNVLNAACMQPVIECSNQLATAINIISRTLGNAEYAGAVKSSTDWGKVNIANDGIMSVNCLGTPACLTTSCKEVVGALNELNTSYSACYSNINAVTQDIAQHQVECIETTPGTYVQKDTCDVINLGLGTAAYCPSSYFLPHSCLSGLLLRSGTYDITVCCAGTAQNVCTATSGTTAAVRYSGAYYARYACYADCYNNCVVIACCASNITYGCVHCIPYYSCGGRWFCVGHPSGCYTVCAPTAGLFVPAVECSRIIVQCLYTLPGTYAYLCDAISINCWKFIPLVNYTGSLS